MSAGGVDAFIGLGSNLDDPVEQVRRALGALADLPHSQLAAHSTLYRSPPLGPPGQPDYINGVARVHTALSALDLLDALQAIERTHGRRRGERWGARTLDLDLLLFGNQTIDHERLQVPHPELPNRAFVLVPLSELAPQLVVPGLGPLPALLAQVDRAALVRLDDIDD